MPTLYFTVYRFQIITNNDNRWIQSEITMERRKQDESEVFQGPSSGQIWSSPVSPWEMETFGVNGQDAWARIL